MIARPATFHNSSASRKIATPYPGTELWHKESRRLTTRDYRLFDIQHAVLPTRLPLQEFYKELLITQQVLNRKHLGFRALRALAGITARHLLHGQTNFLRMLWKFNSVYNPERQFAEHHRPVTYEIRLPPGPQVDVELKDLNVYPPEAGHGRRADVS